MLAQGSNTARVLRTLATTPRAGYETPNHSLNLTLCGGPILGKNSSPKLAHRKVQVSSNVRRQYPHPTEDWKPENASVAALPRS